MLSGQSLPRRFLQQPTRTAKFSCSRKKTSSKNHLSEHDLYKVGTICIIRQLLRLPGGGIRVMVDGLSRARLLNIISDKDYFFTEVEELPEPEQPPMSNHIEALIRQCFELFDAYATMSGNVTNETVLAVLTSTNPGYIADYITQNIFLKPDEKQQVLETMSPIRRLELVSRDSRP